MKIELQIKINCIEFIILLNKLNFIIFPVQDKYFIKIIFYDTYMNHLRFSAKNHFTTYQNCVLFCHFFTKEKKEILTISPEIQKTLTCFHCTLLSFSKKKNLNWSYRWKKMYAKTHNKCILSNYKNSVFKVHGNNFLPISMYNYGKKRDHLYRRQC